jgi:prophage regulatory protein
MAQSRNGVSLLPPEAVRLLRIRDVCAWTSLSRAALYRMVQQGDFPHPRKLGPQVVAWRSDEVAAWIDALCDHRQSSGGPRGDGLTPDTTKPRRLA